MNKEEHNRWIKKSGWTVREAVYLILDIDPQSDIVKRYTSNDYSESDKVRYELEESDKPLLNRLNTSGDIERQLINEINRQTEAKYPNVGSNQWGTKNQYFLNGYTVRNPYSELALWELEYPPNAFRQFAKDYIFPVEKENADIPIFGMYHAEPSNPVTEPPPTTDTGLIQITEELTVNDLREMIEANQALGDVLEAVNHWRKLPPEGRSLSNSLYAGIKKKAKDHKWGNNADGCLSQKQYEVIGDIFIQSSKKLTGGKEKRKYPKWEEFKNKIKP